MIKKIFLFFLFTVHLNAERVDILSNFLEELVPREKIIEETGLEVRSLWVRFENYKNAYYSPHIKKIIIMNDLVSPLETLNLPKEKMVLFNWEPGEALRSYCDQFSRVYTVNDNLVDNKKYFKFYYPVWRPIPPKLRAFEKKKLCVMISKVPTKEQFQIIKFFENKPSEDFELYEFLHLLESKTYRGEISGHLLKQKNIDLLKKFKFCFCFENSSVKGYISEKIFACFAAGCVPIYYGAPNVADYIPKECFIDYRDFWTNGQLYNTLRTMSKETYQTYIDHIRAYLQSEKAALFSAEHFNETVLEAAME